MNSLNKVKAAPLSGSSKALTILSQLLLPSQSPAMIEPGAEELGITTISRQEFDDIAILADCNHVLMRGMEVFRELMHQAGDSGREAWATTEIATERSRIQNAISFLQNICGAFNKEGLDVAVIKSLDHWPDLGSDLDLYTNADPSDVLRLMKQYFEARKASRSWGDRLAHKWNFKVPGLPELVEIHMGRLGQTGEQIAIANSIIRRSRLILVDNRAFRVPAVSDRILISTLQRMYRHFYFRLCDIIDSSLLVEGGAIDYEDLRSVATMAGIWEGAATYLVIVSDYVKQFRSEGLELPSFVKESAQFGGDRLYFRRDFLRVPILPESAALYASQLTALLLNRELKSTARLTLLPYLATAAAVGQKITGSDKGIW